MGRSIRKLVFVWLCSAFFANYGSSVFSQSAGGRNGSLDGIRLWTLPGTSAVTPDQCWHSVGSDPNGDIYVSGMDHVSNSGLYRLFVKEDTLHYVGDARTASQAAGNWPSGETAQKFHVRPTWQDGRVYVATADRTDIGGGYLKTRGFHWYAYDVGTGTFTDLSAYEPGGVGAEQLQIITIAPDPNNKLLYAMSNAVGEIVRYDMVTGSTQALGKPASFDRYIYVNRFMWVDSRGILYFSAGNINPQWYQGESAAAFGHLYSYDPANGFDERQDFRLAVATALEVGQWTRDRQHLYAMDDRGNLYRFDDAGPSWTHLGDFLPGYGSAWSLHLSPDELKIYMVWGGGSKQLVEYDIATNQARTLADMSQLSTEMASKRFVTGYDAWDSDGNFYVAGFTMNHGNVILMRVDPVRAKVALGFLPTLGQVSATAGKDAAIINRTGNTEVALDVLYKAEALNGSGQLLRMVYGSRVIPQGRTSVLIPASQLGLSVQADSIRFTVRGDGNEYVTTDPKTAVIGGAPPPT